jgi:shikimate dehydrogenase
LGEERIRTRVHGGSRTVGVIGWPVTHSLSPTIHNSAFIAMDMDWVYVPMPVRPDDLRAALGGLRPLGFAGANVTMPHKTRSSELADSLSEDAARLESVNTLVAGPEGLAGHNTDAPGFDRFLRRDAGFDPAGRSALLFGGGGAARACALALARGGLASLVVALRDPARVVPLERTLDGLETRVTVIEVDAAPEAASDLVINATPLGAHGEWLPLPPLRADMLVVDLLYRPKVTPMQSAARAAGAATFGGLGLLLHQAALSFELWTGQPPPLAVMSAAALAELA